MNAPKLPKPEGPQHTTPPMEHAANAQWFRLGEIVAQKCVAQGIDPEEYALESPPRTDAEWDAFEAGKEAVVTNLKVEPVAVVGNASALGALAGIAEDPSSTNSAFTGAEREAIIKAAGYTIGSTEIDGWYALLPGETEFKHVEREDGHADMNYLGFYSSKEDLLKEITEIILEAIESGEYGSTVVDGMEEMLAANAWASAVEESKHVDVNLSQQRVEEIMPDKSGAVDSRGKSARQVAREIAVELCKLNKVATLDEMVLKAATADGVEDPERLSELAEAFGQDVAMEALGTGVAWTDDHEGFEMQCPHVEFYIDPMQLDRDGNYIPDCFQTKIDADTFCERYGIKIEIDENQQGDGWTCSIVAQGEGDDTEEMVIEIMDSVVEPTEEEVLKVALATDPEELAEAIGEDLVQHLEVCFSVNKTREELWGEVKPAMEKKLEQLAGFLREAGYPVTNPEEESTDEPTVGITINHEASSDSGMIVGVNFSLLESLQHDAFAIHLGALGSTAQDLLVYAPMNYSQAMWTRDAAELLRRVDGFDPREGAIHLLRSMKTANIHAAVQ